MFFTTAIRQTCYHPLIKNLIFFLAFFSFFSLQSQSQDNYYPKTNYTTKEYGRGFHPANMAIAQDHRGIIYSANGFKLLEFDGINWNSYPINKEKWIISMAVSESGFIYTGSQNEFGFFSPDNRGELKYYSLSDSLDILNTDFTNVWKVHSVNGGIAFQAEEKLFLLHDGKITVINPENSFHTSFVVNEKLYIRERGIGLMELNGNSLKRIEGSEIFDTTGIFIMLPLNNESRKILIGTRDKGFWIYDPGAESERFSKFRIENQEEIDAALITGGTGTGNGIFAIGTMQNGIFLIDINGKTIATINKNTGLSDNDVKQVITDSNGNLWLALNNGISRVEISSPLSFLSEKTGLTGGINCLIRADGILYAGTNTGIFREKRIEKTLYAFEQVGEIQYPVRAITVVDKKVIAGTDAGVFEITGNRAIKIGDNDSFALLYSPETKLLMSGGSKGLTVFRNESKLVKTDLLNSIRLDIIGITSVNYSGNDSIEFWIGTRFEGVLRLTIYKNGKYRETLLGKNDGLPEGPVIPSVIKGTVFFGTSQGIYKFIDESTVKETLPDSLKNNKDFLKGYFSSMPPLYKEEGNAVSFIAESDSKVWICSGNKAGFLDKSGEQSYNDSPFRGIDVGKINFIYPERNNIVWIATNEGLIRFDDNNKKNYTPEYPALIRKVTSIRSDSVLFLGTNIDTFNGKTRIVENRINGANPVFKYSNNSIRFDFSASFYEYPKKTMFSYILEGEESTWSPWTAENNRGYGNLREGKYTFRVKARNVYGRESALANYSFTILPPWYRTTFAYILYIIAGILLIWLFATVYSYRLKRENIRLEGIVAERTAEVVSQKDLIEKKNIVLEDQKREIEDSIRYARRIQSAVIPSESDCIEIFPESFVFFRPLNIVSGDFYWISKTNDKIVFTAADCTGHGVPGAIMSMLGVAFLNEIVNKDHITEPDEILNHLRNKVIAALQQQGISGEARDGMDIALITIDYSAGKLSYAGAYNPLIMIRNGEITETSAEKMPIGFYDQMRPFKRNEIMIQKGDRFYMSSDGYEDQFGGPDGKKFKSKKFKQLLLDIQNSTMQQQKVIIEKQFEEWKGDLPQVDDVVVTGFEII